MVLSAITSLIFAAGRVIPANQSGYNVTGYNVTGHNVTGTNITAITTSIAQAGTSPSAAISHLLYATLPEALVAIIIIILLLLLLTHRGRRR